MIRALLAYLVAPLLTAVALGWIFAPLLSSARGKDTAS